jgi:peptidoglycan/LPS O-acetylase OafA/YrhL
MSGATQIVGRVEAHQPDAPSARKPESRSPLNLSRRIPELDGFRGIAVAIALYFHYIRYATVARPPSLLGYLYTSTNLIWSGMEMFFVLSGFLIGGILLDARDSPNYFSTFYIRRVCRIMPVYFLLLGLSGLAYLFIYRPVGAPLDWVFSGKIPWYSYMTFTQNFWMARQNNIGAVILLITWSLAVEEQFYLLLPLIIRIVRRSALPYFFMAGIVIAPMVRLYIIHKWFLSGLLATYILLPCRMDSLFLGALFAYCLRLPGAWAWLAARRTELWLVLFGLIVCMPALNSAGIPYSRLWMAVGVGWMSLFFAMVLTLALMDSQTFLSRILRVKWLASLGEIGLNVYLFHLGIYCFCIWLLTGHHWLLASWKDFAVTLLALAITITFGKLSWRYFEKPIMRWGHTWQY